MHQVAAIKNSKELRVKKNEEFRFYLKIRVIKELDPIQQKEKRLQIKGTDKTHSHTTFWGSM